MRSTIDGFNQQVLIELNLTIDMAIFLRWMLSFIASGKTKYIIDDEENIFHWIKYTKVLEDLPIVFKSIHILRRMIPKLSSNNENEKPLIYKAIHIPGKGTETYFRFDTNILARLENTKMAHLINDADLPIKNKEKDRQKVKANKNVVSILNNLKSIQYENKNIFSNHEMPTDETHYNKTFKKFQEMLYDLYEGRFLTKYPLENLKPYFKTQYKYYLQKEKVVAHINKCKGNWHSIYSSLNNAAINYSYWHAPDSECRDPDKLPKSINTWLYDSFNSLSMFYVCLLEKPTSLREASAEKIYSSISPKAQKIMLNLYNDNWDNFTYWNNVKNIIKWYRQYAEDLCEKDSNCIWWIGNGLYSFLENYAEWLLSFTNKPNPGNIGIGNKTWSIYIASKKKDHDISITIPENL